jgi:hypothetical protein
MEQDILLDKDGDLLIENGDLVIGPCNDQCIADIISSDTGNWKEFPQVGVGIRKYLHSAGSFSELERDIRVQLAGDKRQLNSAPVVEKTADSFRILIDPKNK